MKTKYVILAGTILISLSTVAQKDEMKALKKIYAKEIPTATDVADFKTNLSKLEAVATEESDKVYAHFYKATIPIVALNALGKSATPAQTAAILDSKSVSLITEGLNSTLAFEIKSGKKVYTDKIQETIVAYKPIFTNLAFNLADKKQFKEVSSIMHDLYLLDTKEIENLYFAASYAVNAQEYPNALSYYNELIKLNYSGEGVAYYAKNLIGEKEEFFGGTPEAKADRDLKVKAKLYIAPRDEKIPSKRGEIYKNIALIYVESGKVDEAKKAIIDARKANPDDESLIITEANLYYETKDFDTYKRIINEALEKNPRNAELVFNLGVISSNNKDAASAEKYYLKAIEIDPNFSNAYYNLSSVKIDESTKILEVMNKLGTSEADNKKYAALKKQRDDILKVAVSYLEKTIALDDKNNEAKKVLVSVYNALEMTAQAKALKAKIQ
jgi:tetratricopeptide (TPR) repeat protein